MPIYIPIWYWCFWCFFPLKYYQIGDIFATSLANAAFLEINSYYIWKHIMKKKNVLVHQGKGQIKLDSDSTKATQK